MFVLAHLRIRLVRCFTCCALGLAILLPAAHAQSSPTSTSRRENSRITADIRVDPDSRVCQTLALIERDSEDGRWLLASAANVPLLDRWRGAEEEPIPETVVREIRTVLRGAELTPTDTMVALMARRIRRYAALERFRIDGLITRTQEGDWMMSDPPPEMTNPVDRMIARVFIREENADRRQLMSEIAEQVNVDSAR